MAQCAVCEKNREQAVLYAGIYEGKICPVCYTCSVVEGITLVKKPTKEQLEQAEKRQSVRQLMEKLSSPQKRIMTKDSALAHKDLSKLKFPEMRQEHEDLVQNYDWLIKQVRRHKKISILQLSEIARVDKTQIESLELGRILPGFEKVVLAIEPILNIKILKSTNHHVKFLRTHENIKDIERKILSSVREKMKHHKELSSRIQTVQEKEDQEEIEPRYEEIIIDQLKKEKEETKRKRQEELSDQIESGKFDFSKKENVDKITLQDLADLKRLKQQKEKIEKE